MTTTEYFEIVLAANIVIIYGWIWWLNKKIRWLDKRIGHRIPDIYVSDGWMD